MEATKSTRKPSKRKPLTDLTNKNPSPHLSSSSSSTIKPQTKSSLNLPLKSLLNKNPKSDLNSKTNSTAVISDDNVNTVKKKKEKGKGPIDKENPSSTLSPPPKTPSVSGIGDSLVFEPSSVYRRRHSTADKMKGKQKSVVEPLSCSLETRMADLRKKRYGDDIGLSKSCPMPSKKKQHREKAEVNASKHELPQDFIEKQRAYFAEIDAFELEEEVASDDEVEEMKKRRKKIN